MQEQSHQIKAKDCPKAIQMIYNNIVHFVSEVAPQPGLTLEYVIDKHENDSYVIKRISHKEDISSYELFFPVLNHKESLSLEGIDKIFRIVSNEKKKISTDIKVYTALLNSDGTMLYYEVNES